MYYDDSMKKDTIRIVILIIVIALSCVFLIGKISNWGQVAQVVTSNAQVQIPLSVSANPKTVPGGLFGMHLSSYYSKTKYNMNNSSQYNPSTGYTFDSGERAVLSELNAKVYRFPAGTDSRYYHLYTSDTSTTIAKGYGYRIADVNTDLSLYGEHQVPNVVGSPANYVAYEQTLPSGRNFIFDFIEDAKEDNAKALLVANIIYGTPAEIVAQVSLLKQNGVEIAGVELGNETNAENIGFQENSTLYLTKARTFALALKSAHPDVKTGLVAAPLRPTNSPAFAKNDTWNTAIANALSTDPALYNSYIVHVYPQVKCDNQPSRELAFECASEYTGYMKNINSLSEVMSTTGKNIGFPTFKETFVYFQQKFPNKKMWLTEWNLSHWAGPQYQGSGYYSNSLFNALFVGLFRNEMNKVAVENPGFIEYAIQHNITGFAAYGLINEKLNSEPESIRIPGSAYVKRALYHEAMISRPIYNRALKDVSVSYQTQEPIDVYTYLDQNANTLFVYYANRSGKTVSFPTLTYNGNQINMVSSQGRFHQMAGGSLLASIGKGGAGEVVYETNDQISVAQGNVTSPALHVIPAYAYGYVTIPLSVAAPVNQPPTVSITSPSSSSTYSSPTQSVVIAGNASDPESGQMNLEWEHYVGSVLQISGNQNSVSSGWTLSPILLKNGANTIKVTVTDNAGDKSTSQIEISYTPSDTIAPTINMSLPSAVSTVKKGFVVPMAATASDNVGVVKVEFLVNGTTICSDDLQPYTCSLWTVPVAPGITSYTLSSKAYDQAGNTKTSTTKTVTSKD